MKNDITAEAVRSLLDYDAKTGFFTWRNPHACSSRKAGDVAGSVSPSGYLIITIGKSGYKAHRIAWLHHFGDWPQSIIDHADGNRLNNAISNLRECDQSQNCANMKVTRRSSTGLKGAYWHKKDQRFISKIRVRGKYINLGYHQTAEQAHSAYVAAAQKYHGEFARAK
jgi:hypothetical protein